MMCGIALLFAVVVVMIHPLWGLFFLCCCIGIIIGMCLARRQKLRDLR